MGWWRVNADTLASSRFVVSPLAETLASLKVLERGVGAHPGERAWLAAHLGPYRARQARNPLAARVLWAALRPTWNADFLTPTPPYEGERDFAREVARVRATPPEAARRDLVVALGARLPAELERDDLAESAAATLEWVWRETVLPTWPRRRRIVEADVVARTAQLSQGGWAAALDAMRPGMRWLGDSRLQVNPRDLPPRELHGARLLFVPVTPQQSWVTWETEAADPGAASAAASAAASGPARYAVVYPCAGALAESVRAPVPEGLGALLGTARAAVLVLLDTPKSTTQLVALTGQRLGSVGRHLRVLLDARLVQRRRAGRSVLYYRTDAGHALVGAQDDLAGNRPGQDGGGRLTV